MTFQRLIRSRTTAARCLAVAIVVLAPPVGAQVQMTDVTTAAGLGETFFASATQHSLGVNWIDFDMDGWPDLFLVGGSPGRDCWLFHNQGDGTFADVSDLLPVLPDRETSGSVFADYDRDGDQDIYVYVDNPFWLSNPEDNPDDGPPNFLFKNLWVENGGTMLLGQPLFEEVAATAGVDDLADPPLGEELGYRAKTAGWTDYDRDGCIDLFVGHWVMNEGGSAGNKDRLYRNLCDGTFEDVTAASGVNPGTDPDTYRAALAFIAAHLDGDLWPDLYVVNAGDVVDVQPFINDLIYLNNGPAEGSTVTFTEITGLQPGLGDDAQAGMGIDVADVDRDGDWDVYVSDLLDTLNDALPRGNVLYLGNGDGTFADNSAPAAGVAGHNSWGVNFFDVDQDGWEDLYVSTMSGATGELAELLYINDGGDGQSPVTFTNVGVDIGMTTGNSRGSAVADYDGDGDLDLAVVPQSGPMQLFRNDTAGGNWLQIQLRGSVSNLDAIGSVVEATVGGEKMLRQVKGGSSAHSQDSLVVHFGLGDATVLDELRVRWPSGFEDLLTEVAANQRLTVVESVIFADGFESGDLSAW